MQWIATNTYAVILNANRPGERVALRFHLNMGGLRVFTYINQSFPYAGEELNLFFWRKEMTVQFPMNLGSRYRFLR
ncbi:hypothetical protein D3C76_1694860 [compost metagenome]